MAKAGDQYELRTGNIWDYSYRDDVTTVTRLVDEGVSAELANKVGWTPLHAAAAGGAMRVISLLLQRGVMSNPTCRAGRTPAMDAARAGHLSALKLLASKGASLTESDHAGRTLLEYARGTALRTWIEGRRHCSSDDDTVDRLSRPRSKLEKRPERQPIGASGKQKAAQLKAKRAAQRAAAQFRPEGVEEGDAPVDAAKGDTRVLAARARGTEPVGACLGMLQCGAEVADGELGRVEVGGVEMGGEDPVAIGHDPTGHDQTGLSVEMPLVRPAKIWLLCVDARAPLLHLPARWINERQGERLCCVLTKTDLVPAQLLDAASAALAEKLPDIPIVQFSATCKLLGEGGAASRRKLVHSALSRDEKAAVCEMASRVAAVCGFAIAVGGMQTTSEACEDVEGCAKTGGDVEDCRDGFKDEGRSDDGTGDKGIDTVEEDEASIGASTRAPPAPKCQAMTAAHGNNGSNLLGSNAAGDDSVVIRIVGHANVGKTSLFNALLGRRAGRVSRVPRSDKVWHRATLLPGVALLDSPALEENLPQVQHGDGTPASLAQLHELCGLAPLAGVREPFSAVRLLAEVITVPTLLRSYNISMDVAQEASEAGGEISPHGICCALAERRGFQISRNGAPDAHRAGLAILQDVVDGAILLYVWPMPSCCQQSGYVRDGIS